MSSIIYLQCSQEAHPPYLISSYAWIGIEAYEIVRYIGMRANHIKQLGLVIHLQCSQELPSLIYKHAGFFSIETAAYL